LVGFVGYVKATKKMLKWRTGILVEIPGVT